MNAAAYLPKREARSRFLTLRGLRRHLLEWGEPMAGQPPLLMLHGWMDMAASFQFAVDALGAPRHCIAMDWRGFGHSEGGAVDAFWFPDYLGDLDALLDAVSPGEPVDLLGHSMGGNVVMSYAGIRPERIRRLVNLEGFGLPETTAEEAPERLQRWLDELKQPQELKPYASLEAVAARLRKTNPRLPADKAAWLAAQWSRQTPQGFELLADAAHKRSNPALYRKAEVLACWARIAAPTLWVEGAATPFTSFWGGRYPREDFEARLGVVPDLRRVVLTDAAHMLHHDQPEALAHELERFLA